MHCIYNIDFDIAGIFILSLICIIFRTQYVQSSKTNRAFQLFAIVALFSGFMDIVTAYTITYAANIPSLLNITLNTIYLISTVLAAFLIEAYILTCIDNNSLSHFFVDFFVSFFYLLLLIINFFTGIIFSFDNGDYIHGPLFLLNFITPMFYLFHIAFILVSKHRMFTKKQLIMNFSIVIFPIASAILQILYSEYLLTFFSYALFSFVLLFSLETPDFIEVEYLQKNLKKEVQKQTEKALYRQRTIELLSIETTQALAQAIDEKDDYTNGHSLRVSAYSVLLAQSLDWDTEKTEHLRLAALLHDIGKIGIPDSILKKPNKLSEDEYEIVKTHTVRGGKILHNLTTLPNAEIVALYHHERYDGKGYPGKYSGKDIPEFARIVNITDAYDAMSSRRVYRDRLPKEEVIRRMKENSGTQFDPDYLKIFLDLIDMGII